MATKSQVVFTLRRVGGQGHGDELVGLFGAPVAHGDDPERAVRATLEMHRCTVEHRGGVRRPSPANRGERRRRGDVRCLSHKREPEASPVMGDQVNVASKLIRQEVYAGQTLVGEETYRAIRRAVTYQPVEPLPVKGKEAPLGAWLALGSAVAPAEQPTVGGHGGEDGTANSGSCGRRGSGWWPNGGRISSPSWARPALATPTPSGVRHPGRSGRGPRTPDGKIPAVRRDGWLPGLRPVRQGVESIFENDAAPFGSREAEPGRGRPPPAGESEDVASRLVEAGLGTEHAGRQSKGPLLSLCPALRRGDRLAAAENSLSSRTSTGRTRVSWISSSSSPVGAGMLPALFLTLARPELLDTRPGWGGGIASSTVLDLQPFSSGDSRKLIGSLLQGMTDQAGTDRLARAARLPVFIEELAASVAERRRNS